MNECIFCGGQAVSKNKQNFPVCVVHKKEELPDMKCACGEFLLTKESKYGPFFICLECGPVSLKKALSINEVKAETKPREITLRSDEVDFL